MYGMDHVKVRSVWRFLDFNLCFGIHDEIKIVGSFSLPPTTCRKIYCAFSFNVFQLSGLLFVVVQFGYMLLNLVVKYISFCYP